MKKGFWLKLIIVVFIVTLLISVMLLVDFNLIASNNNPKFCFKTVNYNDATEYLAFGYKIIKYNINETEVKYKIGSILLRYDPNFADTFKEQIDIKGYIKDITNKGVCVIYIENTSLTKKYNYDKAYASITSDTLIKKEDTNEVLDKSDLKIGQLVTLTFFDNVQEIYPVRGTAKILNIVEDIESGEDFNE